MAYFGRICKYDMLSPMQQERVREAAIGVINRSKIGYTQEDLDYVLNYNYGLMREDLGVIADMLGMPSYDDFILFIYMCAAKADGTYMANEECKGYKKLVNALGLNSFKHSLAEEMEIVGSIKRVEPEALIDIARILNNMAENNDDFQTTGVFLTFVSVIFHYDNAITVPEFELMVRILCP